MEEALINPDEPKQPEAVSLPKKLWEAVDSSKQRHTTEVLAEIPLDYEADDVSSEDVAAAEKQNDAAALGAVSAGDVLAARYTAPAEQPGGVQSIDDRRKEFERSRQAAEAQLDTSFEADKHQPDQVEFQISHDAEITPEDMPESYFERRHEIKDEPGQTAGKPAADDQSVTDHALGSVATATTVEEDLEEQPYSEEQRAFSGLLGDLSSLTRGMYWQAIKTGFWAAIAILVVLILVAMVS